MEGGKDAENDRWTRKKRKGEGERGKEKGNRSERDIDYVVYNRTSLFGGGGFMYRVRAVLTPDF